MLADQFDLLTALRIIPVACLGAAIAFYAASRNYSGDLAKRQMQ
jgi:hypothetical protein